MNRGWVFIFFLFAGLQIYGQTDKEHYVRVHDSIVMWLNNPVKDKELHFHFKTTLSSRDSFTVIGAEYDKYSNEYAFIRHNKKSSGHRWFSEENIRNWKEDRTDAFVIEQRVIPDSIKTVREVDQSLLKQMKGYWVYVYKYQGKYYLHNNWETLAGKELTDSTWVNIALEVYPEKLVKLHGDYRKFTLETSLRTYDFVLVNAENEIYKMGRWYIIPTRRVNHFEIIEYANTTGDLAIPFIEFDKEKTEDEFDIEFE